MDDTLLEVVLHTDDGAVFSAPSYISKCSLGVRGRAAEERGRIDRLTKVPTCPSTQMSNHRGSGRDYNIGERPQDELNRLRVGRQIGGRSSQDQLTLLVKSLGVEIFMNL